MYVSKKYEDSVHLKNSWSFISPLTENYHPTKKTMTMAHWKITCLQFMPWCSWTNPFSLSLMQCWNSLQHSCGFWGMPWQGIQWRLLSVHMSSPLHLLALAPKYIVCTDECLGQPWKFTHISLLVCICQLIFWTHLCPYYVHSGLHMYTPFVTPQLLSLSWQVTWFVMAFFKITGLQSCSSCG